MTSRRTSLKEHLQQRPGKPPHIMKLGQQVRADTQNGQHEMQLLLKGE